MSEFKQYRRSQIAEMADWEPGFDMTNVSVSAVDRDAGSPKAGDKIARVCGADERPGVMWKPIETAPKDGTAILLYDPEAHMFGLFPEEGEAHAKQIEAEADDLNAQLGQFTNE